MRDRLLLVFVWLAAGWLLATSAPAQVAPFEHERAIGEFTDAIRRNPNDARAYYQRGIAYDVQGQYFLAVADFTDTIRLAPDHVGAYYQRGFAHEREGLLDKAIADYRKALAIDPKDVRARAALTRAERKVATGDRTPGASTAATTAAPAQPTRPAPQAGPVPGLILSPLDGPERVISEAIEALARNPRDAAAYYRRGVAFAQMGQYFNAVSDLGEAIRLAPDSAPAYYSRGVTYEKEREFTKALADYRKAGALDPSDSRARAAVHRLEQQITGVRPAPSAPAAAAPVVAPASPPAVAPTVAPTVTLASPGPRVALVIGNGDYRHATRLANPANDAADIAAALRKLGFEVVEGRDLDKRGIEDKLREFGRKLAGARLALFFYAGHGMQVAGKNYLVPVDARLEQPGDLRLDTIELTDVLAQMEAEPRVNLVFLDACRDNPLSRSFAARLGARSGSVSQGLAMVQSAIGTMIAYATQPDAVALDGDGRNSPFTTALLKHIATPKVDIGGIMRRVRADVIAATSQRQVPWDHSSLVGDVVLVQ